MLLFNDVGKFRFLNIKQKRRGRLKSAIYQKYYKNALKPNFNLSYIIPHPNNHITNESYEEIKRPHKNNNYSTSTLISESEKNCLTKNLKNQIKINKTIKKVKTERKMIPNIYESYNNSKNKNKIFTYRKQYNFQKKLFPTKPVDIDNFVDELDTFLLPNTETFENIKNLINYRIINKEYSKNTILTQLFRRQNFPTNKMTYELFHKYIIKKTFKEVLKKCYLNNRLINKEEIKNEYSRQINSMKKYLIQLNQEKKEQVKNESLDSLVINNNSSSSLLTNSFDNKFSFNKNSRITNIMKHKRNRKFSQNNSSDSNYSQFDFNLNISSIDFFSQNKKCKNQLFPKQNSLSLLDNNNEKNIIKDKENTKNEVLNSSVEKKINNTIKKPKNINNNKYIIQKIKNQENKENDKLNTEYTDKEMIKKFNIFLNKNKQKERNKKNEDIMNFINNEKKITFSNKLINQKINHNLFNPNKLNLDISKKNENKSIKKEPNPDNEIKEKRNSFNNSLNPANEINGNDLGNQVQSNDEISLQKNSSSEKLLFEQKLNINKFFLNEANKKSIKPKNKSMKENYTELFYKGEIKKEEENEKNKKIKILLKKKLYLKKKKTIKRKNFKDFINEESYEEQVKLINNRLEEKKLKIKKIQMEEDERLNEQEWQNKLNNFKNYIQRLKSMTKDEFIKDTLKFIK